MASAIVNYMLVNGWLLLGTRVNNVTLQWMAGHTGIGGNKATNNLADLEVKDLSVKGLRAIYRLSVIQPR